jgi:hypothetical protein
VFVDWSMLGLDRVNIYALSDGSATNRFSVYSNPTSNILVSYMASVAGGYDQSVASVSVTGGKYASGYITGDTQPAYDGTLGTAITEVNLPTNNRLNIGADESGTNPLSGHISRLTYFPERLPDATLQAITQ